MPPHLQITATIDFIAQAGPGRECLMAQDHAAANAFWFNIDVPEGHGFRPGDRVRVTVERLP
ncbi:MAG: hypothetical protein LUQ42_00565 [Methanomicrobiales archaeon]|jgi:hypothetical protein|nr:hypothetical protein [Methanomicrobiales archaeon]MDD1639850.1 hypothetical protein [Methanomicrobiales archaeon]MDD1645229.1 hypothetical protein [Methanomicrobiales archaeon]MDD1646864.1 hypothetical protein [Methanomicrobiales archaeon]MDD1647755.1 hypothetical protein [Methanomicrobiales archaeon]